MTSSGSTKLNLENFLERFVTCDVCEGKREILCPRVRTVCLFRRLVVNNSVDGRGNLRLQHRQDLGDQSLLVQGGGGGGGGGEQGRLAAVRSET